MTIRNLDRLFRPRSVAIIGASTQEATVGRTLTDNLLAGGFGGPIMPVNPRHRAVAGVIAYPDVAALPETPDLAVIATPPEFVPETVAALGARGTRAAIVVTAGFGEGDDASGAALKQAMLDAARPHLLRVVGPNCLGVLVPGIGLNASFAHQAALPGKLAFVTQSGAMVTTVLDWAAGRGIGFSHLVSLGGMADVDFGDMLDYLASDPNTSAILLYVEAITHARKFMSAARAAARIKPVLVVKAGRSAEGAKAAATHTGALAGADAVYDAAFRRAGMLRVDTLQSLFGAVSTLNSPRRPSGDRLAIISNGGGVGVLATDALIEAGGRLANLREETVARLDEVLPATWSRANPVDIIGDAGPDRYRAALSAVLEDVLCDGILVLNCPTAIASGRDAAEAVVDVAGQPANKRKNIMACWLGDGAAKPSRELFGSHDIPSFETPERAVESFMQMANYRRNQNLLMQTPPSTAERFSPDAARARAIISGARAERRDWLNEIEAKGVLAAYGVPTVSTVLATTPEEASRRAGTIGGPVAIKIVSPDILHKTDVGGVVLDLLTPDAVAAAAAAMLERVGKMRPDARIDGFAVQPMIARAKAYELIVGVKDDPLFGPVILFGQGGTAVEIIGDTAVALPPLNTKLARELMARTRVHRLLQGHRGKAAVDLHGIELTLIKVAQLVVDLDQIAELDMNPLLADEFGVMAVDARIRVAAPRRAGHARLAIRPYPRELEESATLPGGEKVRLRPVRPEDEPAFQSAFQRLSMDDVRMRFFAPIKRMDHAMGARLTQIDYDREMAFVAFRDEGGHERNGLGVARLYADPDNECAEYAITVLTDFQRRGLGRLLMERLIRYARERGIGMLTGRVLAENSGMLALCRAFGFKITLAKDEPGVMAVRLPLADRADDAA